MDGGISKLYNITSPCWLLEIDEEDLHYESPSSSLAQAEPYPLFHSLRPLCKDRCSTKHRPPLTCGEGPLHQMPAVIDILRTPTLTSNSTMYSTTCRPCTSCGESLVHRPFVLYMRRNAVLICSSHNSRLEALELQTPT